MQGVGGVGGGRSQECKIVDRIWRRILTMLFIISSLSFRYTTLECIYYTFICISFSHSINIFILITHHLFESPHECAALLLLQLQLPAWREWDDLSTMRISMTIPAQYLTITFRVKMTIQKLMMSLFTDHPGKHSASCHQSICSRHHLENNSLRLDWLLRERNPCNLRIMRSILLGVGGWFWPTTTCICEGIRLIIPIIEFACWFVFLLEEGFKRNRCAMSCMESWKSMAIWAHCWCHDKPHCRHSIQPPGSFFRHSGDGHGMCDAYSHQSFQCLWIPLPWMWWRPLRFIVDGMRKSLGLIQHSATQTLHVPTFQW